MTIFAHESAAVHALDAIPLCVQRKAAESQVSLDERAWRALPLPARQRLVELPVDGEAARRAFATLVRWMRRTFIGEREPRAAHADVTRFEWLDEVPPPSLAGALEVCGIDWATLGADARYVLLDAASDSARFAEACSAVHALNSAPAGADD